MLSTENPPPDLPCSYEISQHRSERFSDNTNNNDDDDDDDDNQADLFKSDLDDSHPLPKFSIRDYVFSTRDKNIKNNWPFSQKNLQLCLKNGVKDVLPPFQSLVSVRNLNPSDIRLSAVETKDFREAQTSKVERNNNTQSPAKKCRLIVKVNNIAEPKLKEDSCAVPDQTMASKVCPVCKTFTSSSNTTLNAHIDQCLSGESTVKWSVGSKVIKHRIKPRKTKLMVDIYETALPYTLEDLDRRNGTNWASSNFAFPPEDLEMCGEEKNEDVSKEGSVYIDSNGTKVRILSKLSDHDCGLSSIVKTDKGSKVDLLSSKKKKKYLVHKNKVAEDSLRVRKSCYSRPGHCPESQVNIHEQTDFPAEVYEEDNRIVYDQMKSNGSGMIKQWVGSKRTDLRKKMNVDHKNHHRGNTAMNLGLKNNSSSLGDTLGKKSNLCPSKSPFSSDGNRLLPNESHKRKNLLCNSHDGQPSQGKRPGFSSSDFRGKKNHNFSPSNKKITINDDDDDDDDGGDYFMRSKMLQHQTFSSQSKSSLNKLKSLRKKLLAIRHTPGGESKKNLDLKKRRLLYTSDSDEEARLEKTRPKVLEVRKKRGAETSPRFDDLGIEKNTDPFMDNVLEEAEIPDEAFVGFSKSFDSPFSELPHPSNMECFQLHYDKAYEEGHAAEMLCADKVGYDLVAEMDADESERNYFVDVDPIPIPGPPGSFLPSPGRMGSEELQGNSSLTTCRVQSSVDMDSSDSPISGISAVSNSVAGNTRDETKNDNSILPEAAGSSRDLKSIERCCCSRKEGALQSDQSLNDQESQLLRRRTMTSLSVTSSTYSSGIVSQHSESPSPSPSPNPVLRLMGKNLMVVNKEENTSPQTRPYNHSTTMAIDHQNEPYSFHHTPYIVGNMPAPQPFDSHFYSPDGFRIPANFRPVHDEFARSRSKEIIVIDDSPESEAGRCSGNPPCRWNYSPVDDPYPLPPSVANLRASSYFSPGFL